MSTERPNILCIVSEDCPPRLGAYGDTIARSPNLDRLASQGVVFDNAAATSPVCAPSRFSILTGRHPENVPPAQHMTAWGHMPRSIITYPEMMRAAGYYCTNNSKTHYNVDLDPNEIWDETSGKAHWFNRPAGKPFLAVFNTMLTHESCVFQEHPGAVGPEDVIVPAYLPDTDGTRISLARYYNQIEAMDAWMGDRLAELAAAGLEDDTIIFYYSDHASPMPRSKRFCYDDGVRVPLIVKVPEKWRHLLPEAPGSHITAPVSLVDLLPTFAEIIGVAPPEGLPGQAFMGAKQTGAPLHILGSRSHGRALRSHQNRTQRALPLHSQLCAASHLRPALCLRMERTWLSGLRGRTSGQPAHRSAGKLLARQAGRRNSMTWTRTRMPWSISQAIRTMRPRSMK